MQGETPKSVRSLYVYIYVCVCMCLCVHLCMCVCGDQVTQPPRGDPWELDFGHANSVTYAYSCMNVDLQWHVTYSCNPCMHAHGI